MADRRIHMEVLWVEGSTQSLLCIANAYWQKLKTSVLLDSVLVNFNWMCWASKERRNEKLKGQLEKGRLPLLMSRTSLCLVPNTQCHFARIKTKKTQLRNINIWKPGRFLRGSDLTSIGYCESVCSCHCQMSSRKHFYVQFATRKQQADVRCIRRHRHMIGEAKTFAQLLLHWDHGMNNGRPIKIPFLWHHKFLLGCDGHVSKFPIQSLLLSIFPLQLTFRDHVVADFIEEMGPFWKATWSY